tara:strand:+ start:1615 stop:1806 length:192 start_codon:yes stop_codon:yes gene_type:complete
MTKTTNTKLEEYEKEDALWWCLHHKSTVEYLKLRIRQYQNAETDEDRAILNVLLGVVANQTTE